LLGDCTARSGGGQAFKLQLTNELEKGQVQVIPFGPSPSSQEPMGTIAPLKFDTVKDHKFPWDHVWLAGHNPLFLFESLDDLIPAQEYDVPPDRATANIGLAALQDIALRFVSRCYKHNV
jgi:hypothetical protein